MDEADGMPLGGGMEEDKGSVGAVSGDCCQEYTMCTAYKAQTRRPLKDRLGAKEGGPRMYFIGGVDAHRVGKIAQGSTRTFFRCGPKLDLQKLENTAWAPFTFRDSTHGDGVLLDVVGGEVWRDGGRPPLFRKNHFSKLEIIGAFSAEFRQMVAKLQGILAAMPHHAKIWLLGPLPRYVIYGCCNRLHHMQNWENNNLRNNILAKLRALTTRLRFLLRGDERVVVVGLDEIAGKLGVEHEKMQEFFGENLSTNQLTYKKVIHRAILDFIKEN